MAVREVLTEWVNIDWFELGEASADAMHWFREHHRRARVQQPELFPESLELDLHRGGWAEFAQLSAHVRTQAWDWRYGVLKQLSQRHSDAHDWELRDAARDVAELVPGPDFELRPVDLVTNVRGMVMWNDFRPDLNLRTLAPIESECASWYLGYAVVDLTMCIEWQLAERSNDFAGNPFLPLIRCYAAGFYPFSLSASEGALFGFCA